MTTLSIVGQGNMGSAIATIATTGGHAAEHLGRDAAQPVNGDIVVLAVPYPAMEDVLATHGSKFAGRVVVDITNPLDFETFDSLVVPPDGSAAAQLAERLPDSAVLKAFNTNFAATLSGGTVGTDTTTVLIAGDDASAKQRLAEVVRSGGLEAIDAGSLKRARELEALGFLQLTLAAQEKVPWTAGFAVVR